MAPRLDDVDPHLIRSLRLLGDRYGPLGVALAAAGLTDPAAVIQRLSEHRAGEIHSWLSQPVTSAPPAMVEALLDALRQRPQGPG